MQHLLRNSFMAPVPEAVLISSLISTPARVHVQNRVLLYWDLHDSHEGQCSLIKCLWHNDNAVLQCSLECTQSETKWDAVILRRTLVQVQNWVFLYRDLQPSHEGQWFSIGCVYNTITTSIVNFKLGWIGHILYHSWWGENKLELPFKCGREGARTGCMQPVPAWIDDPDHNQCCRWWLVPAMLMRSFISTSAANLFVSPLLRNELLRCTLVQDHNPVLVSTQPRSAHELPRLHFCRLPLGPLISHVPLNWLKIEY